MAGNIRRMRIIVECHVTTSKGPGNEPEENERLFGEESCREERNTETEG